MHVGDTIFIFCLALIIFGPKKLPEIGRQIGKLMVEFRRASNEFKMQIEEELRASDEAERQKEITAATTMLPKTATVTPASLLEGAAASQSNGASSAAAQDPVISPPSTGVPVNHTFSPVETTAAESISAEAPDAYPEPADGFNPGLNTASNAELAEVPVASVQPEFPTETFEPAAAATDHPDPEKAQASVHHG
ncbi:Twin-arginine translocation protein TatB [Acidisarcina polymorpha]|uniref:Twin-arginine translocation protein TatB n=1 Tax=Acidisarcina polymorpha TaxID=2211140 RepID=A0A2Z5FYA9_9BACT|nr:twin-arginine translocase TatA/TatE family subunit [Acidisarcina polymorpha]AXC11385.1 Twin-arginine translocation protein TatB [Acidisarcina polymorpha]